MMSKHRMLTVLAVLLVASLVLAACPAPAAPAPEVREVVKTVEVVKEVEKIVEVPAEPEVVTIEYWQYFFDPRVDAMNRLIQQFEAENPDVRVIHNSDIPYADYRDKIAASVPAGVGPDVATLFYGWLPVWLDAGYLVPLPEDEFPPEEIEANFSPMVQAGKFEGKYWTLPTAVRTLAMFWNKDLVAAAGLDPEKPPETLDELVEMAKQCTKYDENGDYEIEGYAVEMNGQDHHWFREVLLRQFGVQPQSDDLRTIQWNSKPEGYEAWQYLLDFQLKHKTGDNTLFDGATNAFLNGKVCYHIDGSFRLGSIAKNAPDLNFGVAELPVGPNGEKATFGSYWTHGLTQKAAADPRRFEAAIRFLKFITSPEAGTLWVNKVGELPAQLAALENEELLNDPRLGAFARGLPYAHATFFVNESNDRQALIDAYDSVVLAGEDPKVALDTAVETVQADFDEFWASH